MKDKFLIYKKEYKYNRKFALKYSIILFYIIGIPFLICVFNKFENPLLDSLSKTFDCLQQNAPKGSSIYANINFGNYLEWLEYKTYDDCRFELFLKKVNGKKDILIENANMTFDKLEKYNFEYFLVTKKDVFYKSLKNNENYELICKQKVKNQMYYIYKKM